MGPTATPDFLADEDMQLLIAISKALTERLGKFQINLPVALCSPTTTIVALVLLVSTQ